MPASSTTFAPDWASPPGETIRDALAEQGVGVERFAVAVGLSDAEARLLLAGRSRITMDLAARLATEVGASPEFWVSRDCQYRDDLERRDLFGWLATLPVKDMVKFGWIPDDPDRAERARHCLAFFGSKDLQSWDREHGASSPIRFRASATYEGQPNSTAVWLHEVRRQASALDVGVWDRSQFGSRLDDVRRLTRDKDPRRFIPKLQEICAESGVRCVVVRAPSGCTASGAAFFMDDTSAVIALSARHLSDDHLWYTFFHEAGHLLLHGDSEPHVDTFDESRNEHPDAEEVEADEFARIRLVPPNALSDLPKHRKPHAKEVLRAAAKGKVAPGVVVGQLQHSQGPLGYNNLNSLKRRYKWNGLILETA